MKKKPLSEPVRYFGSTLGTDADLKRHREEEQYLREKIQEYTKEGNELYIRVYKNFLNLLLESKMGIVDKIGRK